MITHTTSLPNTGDKVNDFTIDEERPTTQKAKILAHLLSGKSITPLEALRKFGSFRLAGRIYDLRNDGYIIKTSIVNNGRVRFAEYRLLSEDVR